MLMGKRKKKKKFHPAITFILKTAKCNTERWDLRKSINLQTSNLAVDALLEINFNLKRYLRKNEFDDS